MMAGRLSVWVKALNLAVPNQPAKSRPVVSQLDTKEYSVTPFEHQPPHPHLHAAANIKFLQIFI
jgi:hypothetical protein